jgi:hypothetical protein
MTSHHGGQQGRGGESYHRSGEGQDALDRVRLMSFFCYFGIQNKTLLPNGTLNIRLFIIVLLSEVFC